MSRVDIGGDSDLLSIFEVKIWLDRPVRLTLKLGVDSAFSLLYLQLSLNKFESKICTLTVKIKAIRYSV